MEPRGDQSQYGYYRGEVEAMLACGHSLGAVERSLERAPLDSEQRSALCLLAWALSDNTGENEPVELTLAGDEVRERRARP
jgi:hypothetical protein